MIDDDPDIVFTLRVGLESDPTMQVFGFDNPVTALVEFKPNFYDLLLIDVNMPLLDGFQLAQNLEKQVAEMKEKSKEEDYIIKGKLSDKEKEVELLRQRDSINSEAIANLSDQLMTISARLHRIENSNASANPSLISHLYHPAL